MKAQDVDDWDGIKRLWAAQGFDYELPDKRAFLVAKMLTDEQGVPRMAILARPTVELYMLGDPTWATPAWRFAALKILHEVVRLSLKAMGIQDAHAWLPPEVERSFGNRLRRSFQWAPSRWACWERRV